MRNILSLCSVLLPRKCSHIHSRSPQGDYTVFLNASRHHDNAFLPRPNAETSPNSGVRTWLLLSTDTVQWTEPDTTDTCRKCRRLFCVQYGYSVVKLDRSEICRQGTWCWWLDNVINNKLVCLSAVALKSTVSVFVLLAIGFSFLLQESPNHPCLLILISLIIAGLSGNSLRLV